MADLNKAKQFAQKRAQAERNIKTRIDSILSKTAKDILSAAAGITLVSLETLFRQMVYSRAKEVLGNAENEINSLIRAYSKVSISTLGDTDTGATGRLLNSNLFGKTFTERSHTYMMYFFNDVIKIIIAGRRLRMKDAAIANSMASQFKNPYSSGMIPQANAKGADIQIPAYGRGVYHSAYGNIVRNAQGTIAVAWGREERNFAKRNGAVGFRIHRGSSYPCPVCDEASEGIHKITDTVPPLHVNCVCYVEFVYNEDNE